MSGLEDLLAGRTLVRRYRIEEVIGRGGFAAVYRATDERLGRPVAVKVITLAADDEEARERHRGRFEREARSVASLPQHPNVVTVHDFGVDPELGLDFLVMEFLHGHDLASYFRTTPKPPLELATRILRDAVEGLAVGHRNDLIHRDVKPGNIFLAEPHGEGSLRVCVLDFGIARALTEDQNATRLTREGTPLSPAYASPEQFRGERDLTCASDVFSLGVVGYQLLTGEKPFRQERTTDPSDWVPARRIREIDPAVPPDLEAVVDRALSLDPAERFDEADAFARALDEASYERRAASGGAAFVPAVPTPDATVAMEAAPSAAAPGPDEEHTVLQPEPEPERPVAAPAPRPVERKRSAAIWAVPLVLVLGAAGLWAVSSGSGGGDGDAGPAGANEVPQVVLPDDGGGDGGVEGGVVTGGGASSAAAGAAPDPGGTAAAGGVAAPDARSPSGAAPAAGTRINQRPAGQQGAAPAPSSGQARPPAAGSGERPPADAGGQPSATPAAQPATGAQPPPRQPATGAQPAPAERPGGQQPSAEEADSPPPPKLLGEPVRQQRQQQQPGGGGGGGGGGNEKGGGGGGAAQPGG